MDIKGLDEKFNDTTLSLDHRKTLLFYWWIANGCPGVYFDLETQLEVIDENDSGILDNFL